jgi:hypothetical protein
MRCRHPPRPPRALCRCRPLNCDVGRRPVAPQRHRLRRSDCCRGLSRRRSLLGFGEAGRPHGRRPPLQSQARDVREEARKRARGDCATRPAPMPNAGERIVFRESTRITIEDVWRRFRSLSAITCAGRQPRSHVGREHDHTTLDHHVGTVGTSDQRSSAAPCSQGDDTLASTASSWLAVSPRAPGNDAHHPL